MRFIYFIAPPPRLIVMTRALYGEKEKEATDVPGTTAAT